MPACLLSEIDGSVRAEGEGRRLMAACLLRAKESEGGRVREREREEGGRMSERVLHHSSKPREGEMQNK